MLYLKRHRKGKSAKKRLEKRHSPLMHLKRPAMLAYNNEPGRRDHQKENLRIQRMLLLSPNPAILRRDYSGFVQARGLLYFFHHRDIWKTVEPGGF